MSEKGKTAVFISGRGSNLAALIRATRNPQANFSIALVFSDTPEAPGLQKARRAGLACLSLQRADFSGRGPFEKAVLEELTARGVELICLAGYMRLLGPTLLEAFSGRIINIHPSLLPAFPGLNAQAQALNHGVKFSGCTVHFVDAGVDSGPIILQSAVAVRDEDDEASLAARILRREHRLYPRAVQLFFSGRLRLENRRVLIEKKC